MRGNFDNTGKLVRFILRRERVVSAIWIIVLVAFSMLLAPGMANLFDHEARQQFAAVYDNPVMVAMLGPIYGADNYTAGAMYSGMMLLWVALTVAIMNVFLVARHTRSDEEHGRGEVVRSLPVGRLANLNATMISAVVINGILALTTGLGIFITQVESMDLAGSMLYGAVSGAVGLVFAAITAIFCQLSSNTGGAMGLSFLSLGAFYMLRAAGDAGNEVLSLISPLGLALRSKIYVENNPVPLIFLLIATVALSAFAYKLNSMRDLGQGFIPAMPGRKKAKKSMLSPFGFSFRLLRNTIIVWVIVMFALGGSYGSVIGDIPGFVSDSPEYLTLMGIPAEMVEGIPDDTKAEMIVDGFGVFVTTMMTLIALVPLLMATLKLRSEEKAGRTENILSRSVSKTKYLGGFTVIAFIMSALMQCATVLGLYSSTAAVLGDENPFILESLFKANLAYLPALWLMVGLTVLLAGLFPKAVGAVWGYFGFICFTTLIGGIGILPEWLTKISPMSYIPEIRVTNLDFLPSEEINFTILTIMTGVAALLTVAGFIGYRKRDMMFH
ncbi:MAG: ABC transporter permease [Oscillospiraceae bacterium]|nr:ABC transporter permease [Oscillospiraceae bacterium]